MDRLLGSEASCLAMVICAKAFLIPEKGGLSPVSRCWQPQWQPQGPEPIFSSRPSSYLVQCMQLLAVRICTCSGDLDSHAAPAPCKNETKSG